MLAILRLSLEIFNTEGVAVHKDSRDFIKKTRDLGSIPENAILVTADVAGLYPSILHEAGLKALRELLD